MISLILSILSLVFFLDLVQSVSKPVDLGYGHLNQDSSFQTSFTDIDKSYMKMTIELAKQATGRTHPNPVVGCIIVDTNGNIVGSGFHPKAGNPHAEVYALREAGERARNGTAYVSLEPCNHYGRTPPCTLALIKAGVRKVIAGMVDPDPRVSGNGLRALLSHGIQVGVGLEERECLQVNSPFIYRVTHNKPYVISWIHRARSIDVHEPRLRFNDVLPPISCFEAFLSTVVPEVDTIIVDMSSMIIQFKDSSLYDYINNILIVIPDHMSVIIAMPTNETSRIEMIKRNLIFSNRIQFMSGDDVRLSSYLHDNSSHESCSQNGYSADHQLLRCDNNGSDCDVANNIIRFCKHKGSNAILLLGYHSTCFRFDKDVETCDDSIHLKQSGDIETVNDTYSDSIANREYLVNQIAAQKQIYTFSSDEVDSRPCVSNDVEHRYSNQFIDRRRYFYTQRRISQLLGLNYSYPNTSLNMNSVVERNSSRCSVIVDINDHSHNRSKDFIQTDINSNITSMHRAFTYKHEKASNNKKISSFEISEILSFHHLEDLDDSANHSIESLEDSHDDANSIISETSADNEVNLTDDNRGKKRIIPWICCRVLRWSPKTYFHPTINSANN